MPKYTYTVKDRNGKTFKDVADAMSQENLIERLQNKNYIVISVREIKIAVARKKNIKSGHKKFHHKKVKLNDLLTFARQLATMLEAGVTLIRSLNVITQQIQSEDLYKAAVKIRNDVEQGETLSVALSKHPKIFNQFWVSLIEVGE
ncbi:MAG: type II secretion system F family protein, partial [Candidatus Omnitrophica bacterium]|nr:type II secretion system F family protein [Candidatus Omnitrophota bacterium]